MDLFLKFFEKTRKTVGDDNEIYFKNMTKNNLIKIYSSLYLQIRKRICNFCKENTLNSQQFISFSKKRQDSSNFLIMIMQYEENLNYSPIDFMLTIPQSFHSKDFLENNENSIDNPWFLLGIIIEKQEKLLHQIVYLRKYLENNENFQRVDNGKVYSWIEMWGDIIENNGKPLLLIFVQ